MEAEEKELKSSIKCKIMASFFLLILMIGISVTWILQGVLQKTLIEKGLEEEAITDILSTFMVSGAGISMLAMLVAIGVAYILSRSIAEPIKKLTKVIEDISTGKLDTEIDPELKNS
ncbi:MAG TPA: HAMP domain-containing protein, partial [Candidatus Aenigmarchaeota archaeon]|nr:HAMP domain-containing protein [Candidatus Aenigmarchaeota archaeon]